MKLKDCLDKELDFYPVDCPIKKALRTIAKNPEMFHITKWKVCGETEEAETGKKMFMGVKLEIELTSELYFDAHKKLRRIR